MFDYTDRQVSLDGECLLYQRHLVGKIEDMEAVEKIIVKTARSHTDVENADPVVTSVLWVNWVLIELRLDEKSLKFMGKFKVLEGHVRGVLDGGKKEIGEKAEDKDGGVRMLFDWPQVRY